MRVATSQQYNTGLNNMLRNQTEVNKTQQQVATGRRVLTPADDPVASTKILQMQQDMAKSEQYVRNMNAADSRLKAEEAAMDSATSYFAHLKELTSSASGVKTQSDRQDIAAEVAQIQEGLAQIFNTRDANGEYIFAGFKGSNPPFVKQPNGRYEFMGDEGQRKLAISDSTTVATGDSGKFLFVDVPANKNTFIASLNPQNKGDLRINPGFVVDEKKYAEFYPDGLVITFNPEDALSPATANFTVRRASDGRVVEGMDKVAYNEGGNVVAAGISINIEGRPRPGDQVLAQSSPKQSVLDTVFRLTAGLNTLADNQMDSDTLAILLADTLTNLTHAENSVSAVRSDLGARMNIVDGTRELSADVKVVNQEILSKLQDVDYAEAISRLSLQTFLLEASQQSYTTISRLSLFNHM
ncbi:MAG: hypothetical protein RL217_210 [Pseudomonadota bacterium]|jgi:flagellar hook-associated protein 3 FlgL